MPKSNTTSLSNTYPLVFLKISKNRPSAVIQIISIFCEINTCHDPDGFRSTTRNRSVNSEALSLVLLPTIYCSLRRSEGINEYVYDLRHRTMSVAYQYV